jgi:hypothetical protein
MSKDFERLQEMFEKLGCSDGTMSWIFGGSAPLSLFCQTHQLGYDPIKPGGLDVWVWVNEPDHETPAVDLEKLGQAVGSYLPTAEVRLIRSALEIVDSATFSLPIQVVEVTKVVRPLNTVESAGAMALGAQILDCFDLSCSRVGIVAMDETKAKAYNAVMGEKGDSYIDLAGIRRVHFRGGDADPLGCLTFHTGTCGTMCDNDFMCFPIDLAIHPNDHIKIESNEGLYFVLRPDTLCDLRGYRSTLQPVRPNPLLRPRAPYSPIARFHPDMTTDSRVVRYGRRGFFPVQTKRNPRLVEIIRRYFHCNRGELSLEQPWEPPVSPVALAEAMVAAMSAGPLLTLDGLNSSDLHHVFAAARFFSSVLDQQELLKTFLEKREATYVKRELSRKKISKVEFI